MSLSIGQRIWVPCEVKPGPFSDERMARIQSKFGDWLGFVPATFLREPVAEGATQISVLIIDIRGDRFFAKIPGEALTRTLYEGVVN